MAEGTVIYALVAGAVGVSGLLLERVLALPIQLVYITMILYVQCTFRLAISSAGTVRSLVTCFFLTFGSGLLTALLTGKPLHPVVPTLWAEYLLFHGAFSFISRQQITAFFRTEAVRGVVFLGVALIKANTMVRAVTDILEGGFSWPAVAFAGVVGLAQMLSGPIVYFFDMLIVSRLERFSTAALTRTLRIGGVLTAAVISSCYFVQFLEEEANSRKTVVYVVAHAVFFLSFGVDAVRYGRNFHTKDV